MPEKYMEPDQLLYPSAIYSLNRKLYELLDAAPFKEYGDKIVVVPSVFSKHRRSFHWLAVGRSQWKRDEFSKIREEINNSESGWIQFSEAINSFGSRGLTDALQKVNDGGLEQGQYLSCLFSLYERYHLPPRLYLDGIIYRNLEKLRLKGNDVGIVYAVGELLFENPQTNYDSYPWVSIGFFGSENGSIKRLSLPSFQCQETNKEANKKIQISKADNYEPVKGLKFQRMLLRELFIEELSKDPRNPEKYFIIVPLYDTCIEGKPCGGLWGNLVILFRGENEKEEFQKPYIDKLVKESTAFSEELSRAALSTIMGQPLTGSIDLVEHFVKQIARLQDWEHVIAYRQKGMTFEPEFCYSHTDEEKTADTVATRWERCAHHVSSGKCAKCPSWDEVLANDSKYLRWNRNLSDRAFIPDLTDDQRRMLSDTHLVFEFSQSAVIPTDDRLRNKLGRFYIRQQLEVLHGLAAKERAKKSALQTAAVAIMSRNMSHNIGSHVLARLSNEHDVPTDPKEIATFNNYLRSRMDFLADLSTQSPLATMSLSLFRDVVTEFESQNLLRDRISGIETVRSDRIKIQLNNGQQKVSEKNSHLDTFFASPNGWMGVHALYIILENIIRNSVKHGELREDKLEISIRVEKDEHWVDESRLFKVTIYDNLKNCVSTADKKPAGVEKNFAVVERLNKAIETSVIDETGVLRQENWGIREIKICAAYLRKITPQDIEVDVHPRLLRAVNVEGNLGYEIFLLRPKDLLVVQKDLLADLREKAVLLSEKGIEVTESLTEEEVKKGIDHNFLLLLDNSFDDLINEYQESLPVRVFTGAKTCTVNNAIQLPESEVAEILTSLNSCDSQNVLLILWRNWVARFEDQKQPVILGIGENRHASWGINGLAVNFTRKDPDARDETFKPYIISDKKDDVQRWADFDSSEASFVIYDHHGDLQKENRIADFAKVFYEPYNQDEPIASITMYPPDDRTRKNCVVYELIEAGLIRTAILDERIQSTLQSLRWNYPGPKGAREWLGSMNVKIPGREIDLNAEILRENVINEWIKKNAESYLFLVIHQGVLDRMGRQNKEEGNKWIEDIKTEARIKHVIVDSGRGVPANMPPNARFVHLSNLFRWTVEKKSKYHLCKLFFSSRRAGHA